MKILQVAVLAAVAALCHQAVDAAYMPPPGAVDARVRLVPYVRDEVVVLAGYVGFQIHLEWAEGEEFVSLGAGDAEGISIGSERNHLFIKPRQARSSTNLTVLTNRRVYHFAYSARHPPRTTGGSRDMVWSVRFTYPEDEARLASAAAARANADNRLKQGGTNVSINRDYWFCGAPTLRPLSAFDDGVQTRLRFASRAEFPAIFVRNDDGSESLLNFHVSNDEVVIHRVARSLILRRGQLAGCVVNKSFEGGGARMPSNTVAPDVVRQTREWP